jgi:hypothetical protein
VKPKVAACAGADGESVIDVDGALARTGTFTSPSDDLVAEAAVSVATSVDVAQNRVAAFADPKFASCARDTDVILVRAGRGLAGLFFQSELHPFPVEDTEQHVALAAERLDQVS